MFQTMNTFLNTTVFSVIQIYNIVSILLIILGIGAVMKLIVKAYVTMRVLPEQVNSSGITSLNRIQVPKLKMTRVHIPFTFRLLDTGNTTSDEISFSVSSQVDYTLQAFWGVSIRELHMALWQPWTELKKSMDDGSIIDPVFFKSFAIEQRNQNIHSENIITLKSPKPLVLGAPPRLSYPLVVFLIKNVKDNEILHPDETVLLVSVVHLKDPVCPLPTSILSQYLKQTSGQLSSLKQLYLATGDSMNTDDIPVSQQGSLSMAEPVACAGTGGPLLCSDGPQMEQLCVVCHYFPLSRALLPCRHTCICAICFSKLDRCPMCRAPITSYFCITSEDYVPQGALDNRIGSTNRTKGTIHWLDALNDRLTDFLGFR